MRLAEVQVKWSVILIDRLGPDILLAKPEEGNPLFFFNMLSVFDMYFFLSYPVYGKKRHNKLELQKLFILPRCLIRRPQFSPVQRVHKTKTSVNA